jgi:hypothetical protein
MNKYSGEAGEERSQLYLLRVWPTQGEGGSPTCRGKLQQVIGGRSYCFVDVCQLCALIQGLLTGTDNPPPDTGPEKGVEPSAPEPPG